jgi:hypothetical protein
VRLRRLPLVVEVHRRPEWVRWTSPPPVDELFAHAVPSATGVDGIDAVAPAQHALLIAAHSWSGAPLRRILDSVDSALLAAEAPAGEVSAWARRWDVDGLWRFTERVHESLFAAATPPRSVRRWGRSFVASREPTVLERHTRRVLGPFAILPLRRALRASASELGRSLTPDRGETWRAKLARAPIAAVHAFVPVGRHEATLMARRAARRQ